MLRGRRVVVLAICIGLLFGAFVQSAAASAPLSQEWAHGIATNTMVTIPDSQIYLGKSIEFSILPKGPNNQPLPPQNIQMIVFLGDNFIEEQDFQDDQKGRLKAEFTPQDFGAYRVIFIDTTYGEQVFTLDKQIYFSLP